MIYSKSGLLINAALIFSLLLSFGYQPVYAQNSCNFVLVEQPNNPAMPYKITKKERFIAFLTIQDKGKLKVISIGGNYYTYNPQSKTFKHAEKMLPQKPENLNKAVKTAFEAWSQDHCQYGD